MYLKRGVMCKRREDCYYCMEVFRKSHMFQLEHGKRPIVLGPENFMSGCAKARS
jgi:hypothetical protein